MFEDLSEMLSALEHAERRRILFALAGTTEPVRDPVEVAAPTGGAVASQVRLDILHYHLPELAKLGYVALHEREYVVTKGSRFAETKRFSASPAGTDVSTIRNDAPCTRRSADEWAATVR